MKIVRQIGSLTFILGFFTTLFAGIPWYVTIADDPVIPWWFRIAVYSFLGGILIVLLTLALEQRKQKASIDETLSVRPTSRILLSNASEIPGRDITDVLDIVQGHTIFAIWLGRDLSAIARLILGGELTEYTEMMGKARSVATQRMIAAAEKRGADAIINVRYTTTSVIGSAAELFAYGTAVRMRRKPPTRFYKHQGPKGRKENKSQQQ